MTSQDELFDILNDGLVCCGCDIPNDGPKPGCVWMCETCKAEMAKMCQECYDCDVVCCDICEYGIYEGEQCQKCNGTYLLTCPRLAEHGPHPSFDPPAVA